jgi:hypothetical protein
MHKQFWWTNLKETAQLEDLSVDGRIILNCTSKKQDGRVLI